MTKGAKVDDLVLGKRVVLPPTAEVSGGRIVLGDDVRIGDHVQIEVTESLTVGKGSVLGPHTIVRGRDIVLGREFYTNHHAEIGGGSCFERTSRLRTGHWVHFGSHSIVNTAMAVEIGNEVGLGRFTNLYTHGAYLSALDGFPVEFGPIRLGNRVWLPGATVNPGVTIGEDVVVGVGSVVTKDLPAGCLAVGTPCRVIREHAYPALLSAADKLKRVETIFRPWEMTYRVVDAAVPMVGVDGAEFDLAAMTVRGAVSPRTEQARNYLRRLGVRFKVETESGQYEPWREP